MDYLLFLKSIYALQPYFIEFAKIGAKKNHKFADLREAGIMAEKAMLKATNNINTHRGSIFVLGILIAATSYCLNNSYKYSSIQDTIKIKYQTDIRNHAVDPNSHGAKIRKQYKLENILENAANGFTTVFKQLDKFRQFKIQISGFSGYSLGELTAVSIANKTSLLDLLSTAQNRARFMNNAISTPGSLIAISGANFDDILEICRESNSHVAIKNSDNSIIIGGVLQNLEIFKNMALKLAGNIKIQHINVDIPSHTPLLKRASLEFMDYLTNKSHNNQLEIKVVSGIDASVQYNTSSALANLSKQISQTINFDRVINVLHELGSDIILEIGPGKALSNIINQQNLAIKTRSIDEFNSLKECITWIKNQN